MDRVDNAPPDGREGREGPDEQHWIRVHIMDLWIYCVFERRRSSLADLGVGRVDLRGARRANAG